MKASLNWNGKAIIVSSRHVGIDSPTWAHGHKKHHFKITVECGGRKFTEDYWQPDEKMSVPRLREVLDTLCRDATYGDMSIDDFQSEMCYEKVSECIEAYKGCKKTFENFKDLFIDPYELSNYLIEKYNL